MSNLFGNLAVEGVEATEDRLGGGYTPFETGVYPLKIKVAYAGKSEGGARNITILGEIGDREYRETIYITNKEGLPFFEAKDRSGNKTGKKNYLPGFSLVDNMAIILSGEPLSAQSSEEKIIKIYNATEKKELNTAVQVLDKFTGKTLLVAIERRIENKNEKQGDKYVAIAETRTVNGIVHVFEEQTRMTVNEARAGNTKSDFIDKWVEKYAGEDIDKTDKSLKANAGAPGTAPAAGESKAASKSLFGPK